MLPGGHTQTSHCNPDYNARMVDKFKENSPAGQPDTKTQIAISNPTGKAVIVDKTKDMLPGNQSQTHNSKPNQKPRIVEKIKAKVPRG